MRSLAILLVTFSSCAGEPSSSQGIDTLGKAALLPDSPSVHWAQAKIVYPPQIANVEGGLPLLVPPATRPIVGRQFIAVFTTRPTGPFMDHQTALLVSRERVEPAELAGANGAMLMVKPDLVFTPNRDRAFLNGFLTQEDGKVAVNITFAPGQEGATFYAQLLVRDPRTPLQLTVSPMLKLVVGNR